MTEIPNTSRRAVVTAAAWTLPVVAVAAAAPLAAASGEQLTLSTPEKVYPGQYYGPISVKLSGTDVANKTIQLMIESGDAQLQSVTVTTDVNGNATITGVKAGANESVLRATQAGAASVTATADLRLSDVPGSGIATTFGVNTTDDTIHLNPAGDVSTGYHVFWGPGSQRTGWIRWSTDLPYVGFIVDGVWQPFAWVQASKSVLQGDSYSPPIAFDPNYTGSFPTSTTVHANTSSHNLNLRA